MNWGNAIVLVFVIFSGLVFTMVGICMKQDDLHLVTEQYYEEEIKYQEQIERASNSAHLNRKVLGYDASEKMLLVDLKKGASGTLWLFRPSDARIDQKVALDFSTDNGKSISLKDLESGYWRVKISWYMGQKEYFEEMKIDLR